MIEHEDEIFSRPARTWFQSEKAKQAAKGKYLFLTIVSCSCADKSLYIDAGKDAYAKAYPEKDTKAADANKV
jgi:hypothetical protein